MDFLDMLKKPVLFESDTQQGDPSEDKNDWDSEDSGEYQRTTSQTSECGEYGTRQYGFNEGSDDFDDDDDDLMDDIDDLSDEELSELESELDDDDINELTSDCEPVNLTPDEEEEADNMLALGATQMLVQKELNTQEAAAFYSDMEQANTVVREGFFMPSDIKRLTSVVTEKFFNKTKVQFSKADTINKLTGVAILASARSKNDKDYIKLQKLNHARRILKMRLRKKYLNEARRRVKVYLQRLRQSKSPVLSKLGKQVKQ